MHQLMRRAASAMIGIGIGVTAALTMATAPSAAQPTEPQTKIFLIDWSDFKLGQVSAGDTVTAHGLLKDETGKEVGSSHKYCHVYKLDGADIRASCGVALAWSDGWLNLDLDLKYDSASDIFLPADVALASATGPYKAWLGGDAKIRKCDNVTVCDADTYRLDIFI